MDIFLTGGTGYIGAALLPQLLAAGHGVTALARSDSSAATLEQAGAKVVRGSLDDATALADAARQAGAVVHTASPGDASSAEADRTAASAFVEALRGSGKHLVFTGGIWVHGHTKGVVHEDAPFDPPQLTAWRLPIAEDVMASASEGVVPVVVAPGIVYGRGGGLPNLLVSAPQRDGALLHPGSGDQHWTTIHVDDLAALYVAALDAPAGSYLFGASGINPTVRELAEAVSRAGGLDGKVGPEPDEELEGRVGPLAECLLLDQQVEPSASLALGWKPTGPTLVDELETGSYRR